MGSQPCEARTRRERRHARRQQTRIRDLATQAQAVRAALAAPTDAATLAKTFKGANTDRLKDILETLASLGQARALAGGQSVAA